MFGLKLKSLSGKTLACCLGEKSYSLAVVQNNKQILVSERHEFADKTDDFISKTFAADVQRLHLIGASCRVILAPGLYQLLLMDALDVPDEDLAKALRWRLKGLVNYPLNDLALDAFIVPPHGVVGQRKKVFVAVTPLSALTKKLEMLEAAYLEVSSVDISELALRNVLTFMPNKFDAPLIVISLEEGICQLQIFYNTQLYLVRELALNQRLINDNDPQAHNILLEIQRSIDYCLSELKLAEPKQIIFTPSFNQATGLLQFLQQELSKEILLLNLEDYVHRTPPLTIKEQQDGFYSIAGALGIAAHVRDAEVS